VFAPVAQPAEASAVSTSTPSRSSAPRGKRGDSAPLLGRKSSQVDPLPSSPFFDPIVDDGDRNIYEDERNDPSPTSSDIQSTASRNNSRPTSEHGRAHNNGGAPPPCPGDEEVSVEADEDDYNDEHEAAATGASIAERSFVLVGASQVWNLLPSRLRCRRGQYEATCPLRQSLCTLCCPHGSSQVKAFTSFIIIIIIIIRLRDNFTSHHSNCGGSEPC
jgi:hypothetical protein